MTALPQVSAPPVPRLKKFCCSSTNGAHEPSRVAAGTFRALQGRWPELSPVLQIGWESVQVGRSGHRAVGHCSGRLIDAERQPPAPVHDELRQLPALPERQSCVTNLDHLRYIRDSQTTGSFEC